VLESEPMAVAGISRPGVRADTAGPHKVSANPLFAQRPVRRVARRHGVIVRVQSLPEGEGAPVPTHLSDGRHQNTGWHSSRPVLVRAEAVS
jgi:hypothetical protein